MLPVFNGKAKFTHRFEVVKPTHLGFGHWRTFRKRWIKQHPHCAHCGLAGEDVHHIVPRETAPERMCDPTNVLTLCRACHVEHHKKAIIGPIRGGKKWRF